MTEEELREEATSTVEWESVPMIDRPLFVFAYVKGALTREKRIEELEKEINDNDDLATVAYMQGADSQKKKTQKQLIKAKEILREYIRINLLPPIERKFDDEVKLFKQSEQFLKEVSE